MIPLTQSLTNPHWRRVLTSPLSSPQFIKLETFIQNELTQGKPVFPPIEQIFFALNLLAPAQVKVVILGQDPYHQKGQAHGLSFSVPSGTTTPPSLKNIFKEIEQSLGLRPTNTDLSFWVDQGVLLLNSVLTVTESKPGSHKGKGWEQITDLVITHLSNLKHPIIFLLWGRDAKEKAQLIDAKKNVILTAPHPSPLSAYLGFLGCGHFLQTNQILTQQGEQPIKWV